MSISRIISKSVSLSRDKVILSLALKYGQKARILSMAYVFDISDTLANWMNLTKLNNMGLY